PRTTSSAENPHDRTPEGTSDAPEERETLDADREDEAFDRSEGIAGHDFEAAEGGEAVDEADRAHRRRRFVAARSDRQPPCERRDVERGSDPRARERGSRLRAAVGAAVRRRSRARAGRPARVMPWYVFALVDQAPAERQGRGLAGALAARRVPGGFAIVERRADVPPVELGALERHDTVLARLAEAVPAILPVRFGTLLELEEIESTLEEREEEITEAFNLVRHRVQFTWRAAALGPGPDVRRPRSDVRRPRSEVRRPRSDAGAPGAGTAYLQRAASAAKPAPPAAFRRVRDVLRRMV